MNNQHRNIWLSTLLGFFLGACVSNPRTDSNHTFRVHEEDGVSIAETFGGPRFTDEIFSYVVACTLREDPDYEESLLFRPTSQYWTNGEQFFLADRGTNRIAVYDATGNYSHSFGRGGSGPGEFVSLSIQSLNDDVLSIWDTSMGRTTLYGTDGQLIDVLTAPLGNKLDGYEVDSRGNQYCKYSVMNYEIGLEYQGQGVTVLAADGDTLAEIQTPDVKTLYIYRYGTRATGSRLPYGGMPEIELTTDFQIVSSTGVQPLLHFFNPTGELIRIIQLDIKPETVTPQMQQRIESILRSRIDEAGTEINRARAIAQKEALVIPDEKAYWAEIFLDSDNYVWLRHPVNLLDRENIVERYRVLSPEGEYLGDTTSPARYGLVMHGLFLSNVVEDRTGLRSYVVYRIQSAIEGWEYP
ncbi:6-bladed beta-propeller [Gemmatimonadota bacterium]